MALVSSGPSTGAHGARPSVALAYRRLVEAPQTTRGEPRSFARPNSLSERRRALAARLVAPESGDPEPDANKSIAALVAGPRDLFLPWFSLAECIGPKFQPPALSNRRATVTVPAAFLMGQPLVLRSLSTIASNSSPPNGPRSVRMCATRSVRSRT